MNTGRKLFKLCNWYAFKIEGSIRSDMAKRIMYSVLPHVATPAERFHSGGIVDYKALRAAVEGAKDVIKYGTRAAIVEIGYYDPNGSGGSDLRNKLQKLEKEASQKFDDKLSVYEEILAECVKLFSDYPKWAQSYGGKAWEQIARTLLKLTQLQQNFDLVRIGLTLGDKEYTHEQEISIMKDIIVQLNVFDGLSHNTASILGNLVEQEAQDHSGANKDEDDALINKFYGKEPDYSNEFNKIKRLMDIKEYMNPLDVYKELEQDLAASGDINRYKDWVSRLRRHPDYAKSGRKPAELFLIRLRKDKILPVLKNLEAYITKMYEIGSRATIHKNKGARSDVSALTYSFNSGVKDFIYNMNDYDLPRYGKYSPELQKAIDDTKEKINKIEKLRKEMADYKSLHDPEYMNSDIDVAEFVEKYVRMAKEILHELHSI